MKKHKFKKNLGQNFLINKDYLNKIVDLTDLTMDDLVVEVGAGSGLLTKTIAEKAPVLAFEIDLDLKDELLKIKNSKIIFEDFLKTDLKAQLKEEKYHKLYFIGNLPYYITTPIIKKIINSKIEFEKIIIMIQKEVAERFTANPKTKAYSSITVYLSYYFNLKKEFIVKKENFFPKPNVDSIVVSLTINKGRRANNEEIFLKLVKDSFVFKRKTLLNNLRAYDLELIKKYLISNNLSLTIRAEELSLEMFLELADLLDNAK